MRIGIDYTSAATQSAGIGRYTRELMRALLALPSDYFYSFFYASPQEMQHSEFPIPNSQFQTYFLFPIAYCLKPKALLNFLLHLLDLILYFFHTRIQFQYFFEMTPTRRT